jgi:hypothetical protein
MSSRHIPVREAVKTWLEDPEFRADYRALEEEFALAERGTRRKQPAEPRPAENVAAGAQTPARFAEFRAEYAALKEEFTLASALIEARSQAGLT